MIPSERYRQYQQQPDHVPDQAQQDACILLDRLHAQLQKRTPLRWLRRSAPAGLYLWGPVGRGKTLLMDLFCTSLPPGTALRLHFHRFMARIHRELSQETGHADPLRRIARRLARQHPVLCFDELQVSDIGDAMLLGRLFDELFRRGVTMVATSNLPPEDLYRDGLQRDSFLPAIRLLQRHMHTHALDGGRDHRLRQLQTASVLFREPADDQFAALFQQLADNPDQNGELNVCNRPIPVRRHGNGVVWFDFDALCSGPRSALDYVELAQRYHTLMVSGVPAFSGETREWIKARGTEDGSYTVTATGSREVRWSRMDDPARRFISLVDELYDRNVRLYLSTRCALEHLYPGGRLAFEFRRTFSRLTEMQTEAYLQRPHQP